MHFFFFFLLAAPKISEVVQETKILLQQSRERLIITYVILSLGILFVANDFLFSRVAKNLSSYDTSKYNVSVVPSSTGGLCFHLGEPVTVKWQAPYEHSRKDWIGLYRVS